MSIQAVGANVQINLATAGDQYIPTTTALNDDRFLITWTDTSAQLVKGQLFDTTGTKTGSEFTIMTSSSTGYNSGILKLSNGDLLFYQGTSPDFGTIIGADGSVHAGHVAIPTGADGYFYTAALANGGFAISYVNGFVNIGIQAYNALGEKVGPTFTVPSGTYNEFVTKEVVAFSDGGYGLLYDQKSTGLLLQRFDASGHTNGPASRISSSTTDIGYHSQIDAVSLADGRAFVAWSQGGFIHGRFLDSHGIAIGQDVTLSAGSASGQNWPHVTATTDGHIAVAWDVGATIGQSSLYSLMLASDGSPISPTTVLSTSLNVGWTVFPTALPNGGVLYTWRGLDGNGEGAEARMIDGNGQIVSSELLLNSVTSGNQFGEQAAVNSQGVILATFSDQSGIDGSGWGVFTQVLSINGSFPPPVCFLAGTMIRTPDGASAVESLAIGDLIVTADGAALPVKFIGRQSIASRFVDPLVAHPICICAGALGNDLPARDLYTSPGHAMLIDGKLVLAGALVNGSSIHRMEHVPQRFTYFHIELDEHAVIFAEDAATESFCDNVPRDVFDNAAEYTTLYPDARPIRQLDLPTVKSARQLPPAIRKLIADRAVAIHNVAMADRAAA